METKTLSSFAAQQIQNLILSGELAPAERIKGEYLKHRLGIGLSPIREGLSRLISSGLVELLDNAGFRVSALSRAGISDVYQSYAQLESLLFRESIAYGDDEWESLVIARLYCLEKLETPAGKTDYLAWSVQNEKFHDALISACPWEELKKSRKYFLLLKEWYHNLAYLATPSSKISVSHAEHKKLAELAQAKQSEAACMMLYQHTMHSLDSLLHRLVRHGFLRN